jgi:hypothetical protein
MKKMNYYVTIAIVVLLNSTNLLAQLDPINWRLEDIKNSGNPFVTTKILLATPDCNISNNCVEEENFMPVWTKDLSTGQMTDCPSPLYVRKDQYTKDKIFRQSPFSSEFDPNNPTGIIGDCNIGYVGVNNVKPSEQLHVLGNVKCDAGFFMGDIKLSNIINSTYNAYDAAGNLIPYKPINLQGDFNVTDTLTSKFINVKGEFKVKNASGQNVFAVYQNGDVRARKTTVDLLPIPDYVFKKDYKLMNLKELELYIAQNNHLPNIKSEAEYKQAGEIDLGELNLKLLEKVEELTLYTINQQKQIDELKKMILELKK